MKTKQTLLCSVSLLTAVVLTGFVSADEKADYVAHEWGTFTSVQGGDGDPRYWRPLETSDLPAFVYDWTRPGFDRVNASLLSKGMVISLQRMETPVIYFYSGATNGFDVDVSVRFPAGQITEWFPQARRIGPAFTRAGTNLITRETANAATDSRIEWRNVRILPAATHSHVANLIPSADAGPSHYFAARETDADFVQSPATDPNGSEFERFLFYRGVGSFGTPLRVTMNDANVLTLSNAGPDRLTHFFVLTVHKGRGQYSRLDHLDSRESAQIAVSNADSVPLPQLQEQLADAMSLALASEGLYPREARAMVNTWKDSWFAEEGVRVLYVLPRAWTDATLPLTLNPKPKEIVRVMVGRAEVIPPGTVAKLKELLVKSAEGDTAAGKQALAEFKRLGRFGEAGLALATENADPKVAGAARQLLQSPTASTTRGPALRPSAFSL